MGPRRFFSLHRSDFTKLIYLESPRPGFSDHDIYSAIMTVNAESFRE